MFQCPVAWFRWHCTGGMIPSSAQRRIVDAEGLPPRILEAVGGDTRRSGILVALPAG